jgi:hypothetical protein
MGKGSVSEQYQPALEGAEEQPTRWTTRITHTFLSFFEKSCL